MHVFHSNTTIEVACYNEILKEHLKSFNLHQCKTFEHDNASCHRAKKVTKWLKDYNINVLKRPEDSLDHNSVENIGRG